jgi:serine/threonine-protein kinase
VVSSSDTNVDARKIAEERIGKVLLDKWRLERLIGIGGMAAVYAGRHRNGMLGAVKVLDPVLSRHAPTVERFLREGRIANEVKHAGAVRVLDDDETADGCRFLVMELLEGSTLEQLAMRRGGTLAPCDVLVFTAQVLDTLAVAHAAGVVHRDIKPENLFLTKQGVMKVVDFGVAKMSTDGEAKKRLTRSGDTLGTPAFMAPEQARGRMELVDARSDVYSLGATMFTLLTGDIVHHSAQTVEELLVLAVTKPAPRLAAPDVPEVVAAVVNRALSFAPSQRYASALEMREAVEEAHRALTGHAIPDTPVIVESSLDPSTSAARYAATRVPLERRWRPLAALVPIVVTIALVAFALRTPARSIATTHASIDRAPIADTAAPTIARGAAPEIELDGVPPTTPASSVTPPPKTVAPTPTLKAPATTALVDPTSRRSALFDRRN